MSRFIVVVRENTLQDGKLNIPEKFVSENERILKKELIVLKAGKGDKKWEVNLEKHDDGKVWLHGKGWKEFEDRYSIKHGYFLQFTYQGNSSFKVVIFNKTATEIAYSSNSKSNPTPHDHDHDQTDSDSSSVQILDGFSMNINPRAKKAKATEKPPPDQAVAKGGKQKSTKRSENAMDMDKKATAIQRAEAFKSKNPFFWISLPLTYVQQRYMNIPKEFLDQNYLGDESTDVILKDSKGRTWPVEYVYKVVKKKPLGKFCSGWKKFVKDNNLQVGHVCLFELIKGQQVFFLVRIFQSP